MRSPVIPWNATGPLTIGGVVQLNGTANNYFTGAISDARVFQKALDPDDVTQLYNSGPGVGPQARPGALSAGNATATLDQTVRSTPNLRTVVLALGTNDILDGANVTSIEQKLTSLMSCLSPTGLKCLRRADGSLVHVVLTTVPPLGLAAGDQREKNRQQLNADLVARFNDRHHPERRLLRQARADARRRGQHVPAGRSALRPGPTPVPDRRAVVAPAGRHGDA